MLYAFFQKTIWPIGRALFWFFLHLRVEGGENCTKPRQQILIICNNRNLIDSYLASGSLPFRYFLLSRTFRYPALKKYINSPFYCFIRLFGSYPIEIGVGYEKALVYTEKLIKKGQNIFIFPEGKVAKDGHPLPAKPGVAYLAKKYNLPILPIACEGTRGLTPARFFLRKNRVHVQIGPKFHYQDVVHENDDVKVAAQKIMDRVNQMLYHDKLKI